MKINDKLYDVLKWVSILLLPATSSFIAFVFPLWGIPYGDKIAQTITATATFIGIIIGISTVGYNKSIDTKANK